MISVRGRPYANNVFLDGSSLAPAGQLSFPALTKYFLSGYREQQCAYAFFSRSKRCRLFLHTVCLHAISRLIILKLLMIKTTSILIIDDHTLVRETWSFILDRHPGFSVVGECGSAEEGIELVGTLRPDIIILDINLPGLNGLDAVVPLHQQSPSSKILGVSMHTEPTYARRMVQKGAMGYVTKNSAREEMFRAITEICQGRKYICQEIKNKIAEQVMSDEELGLSTLTDRELDIIARIRKGDSSKEIAESLGIKTKTIEVHRYNILHKLKLKNTAALINFINHHQLSL
jgi:DNA-binding NarL/FixJ family response regulator